MFTTTTFFSGDRLFKVVFPLLILLFIILTSSTSVSAQSDVVYKKHEGASYMANEGGDLGKLLQRTRTKDAVGNFTINITGDLPKISAQLSVYAYDVDEERGETLSIYLNDNYLGKVSGTNDSWNTSVFEVKKEILVKGKNRVRFVISDSSKKGTIKWSGKVGWGQIMIDGGAAESGVIADQVLNHQHKPEQFQTSVVTSVKAEVTGNFILEISMVDKASNTITAGKKELAMKKGDLIQVPMDLKYSSQTQEDQYQIVTNLFYKKEGYLLQQDIRKSSFQLQKEKPITTELVVNNPIKDVDATEDTEPITVNLEDLFAFDQNGKLIKAGESLIEKSIAGNSNSDLLSPQIKGEILTLSVEQGVSGEAEILIQGEFEGKTVLSGFLVRIAPKPVNIPILPPPAPVAAAKPEVPKPVEVPVPKPSKSEILPITVAKKPVTPLPPPKKPVQPASEPEQIILQKPEGSFYGAVSTGLQFLPKYRSAAYFSLSAGKEFPSVLGNFAIEILMQQTVNHHKHDQIDSAVSIQSLGILGAYSFYTQSPQRYSPFSQNPLTLHIKAGAFKTDSKEHGSAIDSEDLSESLKKGGVDFHLGLEMLKTISTHHKLFLEIKLFTNSLSNVGFGYQCPISL